MPQAGSASQENGRTQKRKWDRNTTDVANERKCNEYTILMKRTKHTTATVEAFQGRVSQLGRIKTTVHRKNFEHPDAKAGGGRIKKKKRAAKGEK